MKVKHGDLVSRDFNTRHNVTRALFEFIGIPFSEEVADNVDNFRSGTGDRSKYFGVYRPDDYNPDHWEDQIQHQVKVRLAPTRRVLITEHLNYIHSFSC